MNSEEINKIIQGSNEPVVFKNVIKSKLEIWTLADWNKLFKDQLLSLRCGKNEYNAELQWESTCKTVKCTFQDFITQSESTPEKWLYFDYKYLRNLTDVEVLEESIPWENLGLCDMSKDAVLWIGSKGAHTCCHKDTYGCNVVYQIYGRKQWLIFPPKENLRPTRIPYEESSIYSKLNFFSPKPQDFIEIDNCYKAILNPGDVLLVPHNWWHYVENLETSISVNIWVGLPQDGPEHVKEAIAQIIFSNVSTSLSEQDRRTVLNPNMIGQMESSKTLLSVINHNIAHPHSKDKNFENIETILAKNKKYISTVPKLSKEDFHQFLRNQRNRFDIHSSSKEDSSNNNSEITMVDFLDVLTDDEILTLISNKLAKRKQSNLKSA